MDKFSFNLPSFEPPRLPTVDLSNMKFEAETISEQLFQSAQDYQRGLDPDQEVGVMLASFGQTMTINITGIGHKGAKLVKFTGFLMDNGSPVELYQHVNQISFLLVAIPKANPEEPKKRIGFIQE
ncbi:MULTISPECIES: DUF6173 family protein [unclassified Paenibacillus]|uniref:DUF6173 family protein n=1 Tax=unclassified Paenibacillus TaxID=185978 RepID=UPI002404EA95|nr:MULTISPECIES: DUF6173 family protein [unclassified Paenibacillus]MDF9845544.1 hypothetical protein [Paenibacillus sp. PastF-2]MDF9852120.1 hypothetical protein [Paenibacillus sp. PastM-2]MDF9858697.1 hypothetical protein [Paenibacillus sp. PastF-1]MDH6483953.1 hypothetical protein [Paenibacillus sp. PastH-2]MDH6511332.1 hypothetical protein [Paenibacillus sp. PastM-3]